jgi:hypothetical protein
MRMEDGAFVFWLLKLGALGALGGGENDSS